jgi:glutamate-ammonia-ligase adenylyltransferase
MAESLVTTAARLVHAEMVRLYGKPLDAQGNEVGFAIFGLGKLGGIALGYASDIELLFLFGAAGKTAGGTRGSMPNDEFFAICTRETCDYIHAKREGIFQVDLRLRPFGKGGPLACSKAQFGEYYGEGGDAHAFERLALVRLRWIAGDARLGFDIEQLRDAIVYDGPPPDTKAIWEITDKMRAQHLEGRKLNSKYSPGALTDLEGAVQLLQVASARKAPQLRTPRLHEALEGLRRAQILSPVEFDELMGAYQFLRRLINAQRVLRGSAQDLSLPASKSDELIHLARRMNYIPGEGKTDVGAMLLDDFQRNTAAVQQFIKRRLKRLSDA